MKPKEWHRLFFINKSKVVLFLFVCVVFIITRQVPFNQYSWIANIALFGLFVLQSPRTNERYGIFLGIVVLIGYSLCLSNHIPFIIRFAFIIWFILAAYYLKLPKNFIKILIFFCAVQCIFLICLELILLFYFTPDSYLGLRAYCLEQGWGDLYTYSGYFYKIQFKGNALLPFVYMLSYVYDIFPSRKVWRYRVLFFISIVIAGNFAYFIALGIFHFFLFFFSVNRYSILVKKGIYVFLLSLFLIPFIMDYVTDVLGKKDDSLGTRYDQCEVLINDLTENPLYFLFGKGLGNTVDKVTAYRDYTQNIYYEMQVMYFVNQMGVFFFAFFVCLNVYLALKYIHNKKFLFVYGCYIIYAVTNPYILDTNHVIVILTLVTLNKIQNDSRVCVGFVQS